MRRVKESEEEETVVVFVLVRELVTTTELISRYPEVGMQNRGSRSFAKPFECHAETWQPRVRAAQRHRPSSTFLFVMSIRNCDLAFEET